jgi:peptide/nickel transport system ATP-binding protein
MYAGNVIEISNSEKIFDEPLHPYTKGLISSIPIIGASRELTGIPGSVPDLVSPPSGCRFHPRCDFCFDRCRMELPALSEILPGHFVACHLYSDVVKEG